MFRLQNILDIFFYYVFLDPFRSLGHTVVFVYRGSDLQSHLSLRGEAVPGTQAFLQEAASNFKLQIDLVPC